MAAIPVFTKVSGGEAGGGRVKDELFDLSFVTDGVNSNYTVGGIALNPRQAGGFVSVLSISAVGWANAGGTAITDIFLPTWDHKRQRLQIFGDAVAGTGINELGAVDISGLNFRVRIVGN